MPLTVVRVYDPFCKRSSTRTSNIAQQLIDLRWVSCSVTFCGFRARLEYADQQPSFPPFATVHTPSWSLAPAVTLSPSDLVVFCARNSGPCNPVLMLCCLCCDFAFDLTMSTNIGLLWLLINTCAVGLSSR